jgi:hypothetical protein
MGKDMIRGKKAWYCMLLDAENILFSGGSECASGTDKNFSAQW